MPDNEGNAKKLKSKDNNIKVEHLSYCAAGCVYFNKKEYEKALASFKKGITHEQIAEYENRFNSGAAYFKLGKFDKALAVYKMLAPNKIRDQIIKNLIIK